MCGASIKQQRICGGKRNKLVFLFFFLRSKMKKVSFRNKRTRCRYYVFSCVLCIKISRIISLSLSLSFFHSLSRFLKSSLSLYFFFTSLLLFSSLSLSLSRFTMSSLVRTFFIYSCLARFLAFISLNFWAIMKDNSIA